MTYQLTAPGSPQSKRFAFALLHGARHYLHGRDPDAADLLLACELLVKWGTLELDEFWWPVEEAYSGAELYDSKMLAAGDR